MQEINCRFGKEAVMKRWIAADPSRVSRRGRRHVVCARIVFTGPHTSPDLALRGDPTALELVWHGDNHRPA